MGRPSWLALALLTWVAGSPRAVAGPAGMQDPETGIRIDYELPTDEVSPIWTSLIITVENPGETHRLAFQVAMRSEIELGFSLNSVSRMVRTIEPGIHHLELPVLRVADWADARLTVSVDGRKRPNLGTLWAAGYSGTPGLVVMGRAPEDLSLVLPHHTEGDVLEVRPEQLSRFWQTYGGAPAMVILDRESEGKLDADQKAALVRWVRYAGGTVWVRGPAARETARRLGVCADGKPRPLEAWKGAVGEVLPCLTGQVVFGTTGTTVVWEDLKTLLGSGAFRRDLFGPQSIPSADKTVEVSRALETMLTSLHKPPLLGYAVISILIALIIGPINYWWVRRRGTPVLFFVTTPLLALVGMLALGAYSLASQGLTTRIRERALLLHDLSSDRGMVYLARAVRAGKTPDPPPTFSIDTLVFPFSAPTLAVLPAVATTDWTGAQRLESGYVTAREPRGLVAMAPVPVRMAVSVSRDASGRLWVTNGLPDRVANVYVRVPGGPRADHTGDVEARLYRSSDIPSGGRKPLIPWSEADGRALPDSLFMVLSRLDWHVVAACDGLPLLPDGGVTGEVQQGKYLYVSAWPSPGVHLDVGAGHVGEEDP